MHFDITDTNRTVSSFVLCLCTLYMNILWVTSYGGSEWKFLRKHSVTSIPQKNHRNALSYFRIVNSNNKTFTDFFFLPNRKFEKNNIQRKIVSPFHTFIKKFINENEDEIYILNIILSYRFCYTFRRNVSVYKKYIQFFIFHKEINIFYRDDNNPTLRKTRGFLG